MLKFFASEEIPKKEFFITKIFFLVNCLSSPLGYTPTNLSISEKVMLTITPLKRLVVTDMVFDRNAGAKASKIQWLF